VVDGEKPGVDSRDEGKHTGRNDLLFADNMMWTDELAGVMGYIRLYQGSILALMLPGRPLCAGGVYGRSSPVSLCSLRGPPGALDSDVYWPAQLGCVWLQDLEPTTNGPSITRTVALFIQAPAQDPLVCSSTRQCWLQLWVSCTVVQSALL